MIDNNVDFYKNRKTLVTGHTGFKGSWLTCMLDYLACDYLGYSLEPEEGSLYTKIEPCRGTKNIYGDLLDYEKLLETFQVFKPEIVVHLAAFGFVKECYDDPYRAYSTNVMGTVNLLRAVRECETVKSVVIVSTDKVYADKEDEKPFVENDRLGGLGPYSSSKTCMELVVNDFKATYFNDDSRKIGIAIARASNVLAGGDHIRSRLIPSILRAVDEGKPVELRNPNQTRPWQSVMDALNGYLSLGRLVYYDPDKYSQAWNIGPTKDGIKTVSWIFNQIEKEFGNLNSSDGDKLDVQETQNLSLDISKSIEKLDWKPLLSCEETVKMVVDFYKKQKNGMSEYDICIEQITYFYGGLYAK